MPRGCAALIFFLVVVFVLPYLITDVVVTALARLGLSPAAAMVAAIGIFFGSFVNLPVYRYERDEPQTAPTPWLADMFGTGRWTQRPQAQRSHTIIAVNVGGCLVPLLIVVHELGRLAASGGAAALTPIAAATVINVAVCWRVARPVANVGIAIPALVPPIVAAVCAIVFAAAASRAPVAFCAGVLGPLIGADLMHLRDIGRVSTGVMSIGGAGTFDGIVMSGLLAILLA